MTSVSDRIKGCILGLAVGDALGAPIEFMSQSTVIAKYGVGGPTELGEAYGVPGGYTDDTQMSIATALGIISTREFENTLQCGPIDPTAAIYLEYKRWYATQRKSGNQRRGPGSTCLQALGSPFMGTAANPINDSKGCGGIMRAAPVGLLYTDPHLAWIFGVASAAITHGHPDGYLPAGFLAVLVSHFLTDSPPSGYSEEAARLSIRKIVREAETFLTARCSKGRDSDARTPHIVREAVAAVERISWDDETAMRKLGAGWVGEEALALSLFIMLRYPQDFRGAVQKAVLYSGDRDSVGCITGALMGTLLGYEAIPKSWVEAVENRGELEDLADRIVEFSR